MERAELLRRARRSSRVWQGGIDLPPAVRPSGGARDRDLEWARPLGVVPVARALGEARGLGAVLRGLESRGPRRAPHALALFTMVANRLAEPLAKLAGSEYGRAERADLPEAAARTWDPPSLALDFLAPHIEAIERAICLRTAALFRADVALICWATTRVYGEVDDDDTEGETQRGTPLPPLRQRGYTTEGRGPQAQGVVGLALRRDGWPVRSWGVPGHTGDATTGAHGQESLRGGKRGRALFVGDAGLASEVTRQARAKGLGHSRFALPVGKLTAGHGAVLGRAGRCRSVPAALAVKAVVVGEGERRRRSMGCRNVVAAARQRQHREEGLAAARQELARLAPQAPDHTQRAGALGASKRYGR